MEIPGQPPASGVVTPQAPEAPRPPLRAVEPPPPPSAQEQVDGLTIEAMRAALEGMKFALEQARGQAEFWRGVAEQLQDTIFKNLNSNLGVAYAQHRDMLATINGLTQTLQGLLAQAQQDPGGPTQQDFDAMLMSALMRMKQQRGQGQQQPRQQGQQPPQGQGGR